MDEACYDDVIWIWDPCFMTLFNKYAVNDYFSGVANLNNFYYPLYDNVASSQSIWFPDSPYLFAWVEWENYLVSGDTDHVEWLINERLPLGYTGANQIVGMDNGPRGAYPWRKQYPLDRYGLSAGAIGILYRQTG